MLVKMLIVLLVAFGFRVRGGFGEMWGWKMPLCKFWFAAIFAACDAWLNGWDLNRFLVLFIAARLSTQLAGWGEFVGCVLGKSTPQKERKDFPQVDEFLDTFSFKGWWKIPPFKLIEHPVLFGWLGLTLRGVYLTFIIGLALNSIPYMLLGLTMGSVYWFAGWLYRHGVDDKKNGWRVAEWLFGAVLGVGLVLFY